MLWTIELPILWAWEKEIEQKKWKEYTIISSWQVMIDEILNGIQKVVQKISIHNREGKKIIELTNCLKSVTATN